MIQQIFSLVFFKLMGLIFIGFGLYIKDPFVIGVGLFLYLCFLDLEIWNLKKSLKNLKEKNKE